MSTWSGRVLGTVAWVGVVALGSLLVWAVISRAGAGLVDESGVVTAGAVRPDPDPGGTPSGTAAERRGSWQGEAGLVTAVCRGSGITLVGAQPEAGRVVRVLDDGPVRLLVAFRGDDDATVSVLGRCGGGRPVFSVASTPASQAPTTPAPSGPGGGDGDGSDTEPDRGPDGGTEGG